jgi:hypothetical protein
MRYKKYYITRTFDIGENEGGVFCEVYLANDTLFDEQIDSFSVPKDIEDVEEYIKNWINKNL